MSKEHKKCGKKGECKKEFCKKAGNDNAANGPVPAAPDANAPKKPDAGCCKPKKDGKKDCGCGC